MHALLGVILAAGLAASLPSVARREDSGGSNNVAVTEIQGIVVAHVNKVGPPFTSTAAPTVTTSVHKSTSVPVTTTATKTKTNTKTVTKTVEATTTPSDGDYDGDDDEGAIEDCGPKNSTDAGPTSTTSVHKSTTVPVTTTLTKTKTNTKTVTKTVEATITTPPHGDYDGDDDEDEDEDCGPTKSTGGDEEDDDDMAQDGKKGNDSSGGNHPRNVSNMTCHMTCMLWLGKCWSKAETDAWRNNCVGRYDKCSSECGNVMADDMAQAKCWIMNFDCSSKCMSKMSSTAMSKATPSGGTDYDGCMGTCNFKLSNCVSKGGSKH